MFYYKYKNDILASTEEMPGYEVYSFKADRDQSSTLYFCNRHLTTKDRFTFTVSHISQLNAQHEDSTMLCAVDDAQEDFEVIRLAIEENRCHSINLAYSDWEKRMYTIPPKKWTIHCVGLGDVGGILLTGLKLLGAPDIEHIGIYDPDPQKCQRWFRELGQICYPFEDKKLDISVLNPQDLFNCDLFIFCASRFIPPIDGSKKDVRLVQLESNAAILKPYVQQALCSNYKGIFAIVSDPVDHLCRVAYQLTQVHNQNASTSKQFLPEQIRGYGLGVMNGRAMWYATQKSKFTQYTIDGRAFGPHGKGLIIANSISQYNEQLTEELTALTVNANFEVRDVGFKPYIAPALSSGAISIIKTIRGEWHYSAISLGGVFMGCCNRLLNGKQQIECLDLSPELRNHLKTTYEYLEQYP